MIPFGKAKVVREGSDLTVVTCGAVVKRSLDAARMAGGARRPERGGHRPPLPQPAGHGDHRPSVKKTNRVIVAHEDSLSWGIGSEISARIASDLFEWLDAPVKRVASLDTWVAYAPQLEAVILPDTDRVLTAIREVAGY
jgi:2-oxoisovalerate dehydrogenase E1 component